MATAVLSAEADRTPPAPSALAATERARARAFRAARRHTWFVRALKLVLPLAALFLLVLYPLTIQRSLDVGPGRLAFDRIDAGLGHLTMENPSYEGFDKAGNRYRVHARTATLDPSRKEPIRLQGIEARLQQGARHGGAQGQPHPAKDRSEASTSIETRLTAARGVFDQARHELDLLDAIDVRTSNGISARLTSAKVYARENKVVSLTPVAAEMPTGKLRAGAMVLHARSREAEFTDGVAVELDAPSGGLARSGGSQGGEANVAAGPTRAGGQGPIRVDADSLLVDDTAHVATFLRRVRARQGDMVLTTSELRVEYTGTGAAGSVLTDPMTAPSAAPRQRSEVKRIIARSGVVVASGSDRRITGEAAVFDAVTDSVLLTGDVVATQGKNVLRGRRLSLDRGQARLSLDAPAREGVSAGRIAAVFYQNAANSRSRDVEKRPRSGDVSSGGEASSGALGGLVTEFRSDPTAPVDIEADRLDVDDRARTAIFRGTVRAAQGGFVMRADEITARYTGGGGLAMAERGGTAGNSALSTIEARRDVVITSKEGQRATGDWAIFDTRTNVVTLGGRVIVSQGKNVIEGERLVIDTATGLSRFEHAAGKAPRPTAKAAAPLATPSAAAVGGLATKVPAKPAVPLAPGSAGRPCPPGRTCLMLFPKEDTAKGGSGQRRPGSTTRAGRTEPAQPDAWQPSTSASPVMRNE